ncbi:MAG: uncharacterized protein V7631_2114 [Massilia sp.]|jgi:TPR repeat protein
MRKVLAVFLLCVIPLLSNAKGEAFGAPPSEPFLKEVQDLEIAKLVELHKSGRSDATVQHARSLWWEGDAETPIELLIEPAEEGIPVAQYLLGMYLRFKNRDLDGSAHWMKAAAEAGHPIAQETLAGYYEAGSFGFPADVEKAYRLYRSAAGQGLKHSQLNVGMMLCAGKGVALDKREGAKWFRKANKGQRAPFSLKDGACE